MSSERQEINQISPWWGEHLHRYEEVIKSLSGHETILDIACGTGFGASTLSNKTSGKVYGGDLSKEAIALCNKSWQNSNLTFKEMDATILEFEDDYFDTVVSFETIEHTTEYEKMLYELKRVTSPNGTTIISTPNILINSPTGIVTNPYHTQEWNYEELRAILTKIFPSVEIYGQKYTRYSNGKNTFGEKVEKFLYLRGIRKTPIKVQDAIMKKLIGKSMYPLVEDYSMVKDVDEIKKCKTFFCICKK